MHSIEENREAVLSVEDLSISFRTGAGIVRAVRGMGFQLYRGETLAVVGESGSGKSVTCKAIAGILADNSKIESGSIRFWSREEQREYELLGLAEKEMRRKINGKRIAMVFQDPLASLDPTMTIGAQLTEGMRRHLKLSRGQAHREAVELLEQVGISDAARMMGAYPHQLSGGMRQRVVIAIALSCHPDILICDEPTTALDVTIQKKILELIREIQKKHSLSVIYITHDLAVVAQIADRVLVMYAGQAVEEGLVDEMFFDPRHPYTWGLLLSLPPIRWHGGQDAPDTARTRRATGRGRRCMWRGATTSGPDRKMRSLAVGTLKAPDSRGLWCETRKIMERSGGTVREVLPLLCSV